MNPTRALHRSLIIVWLGTALVSAIEADGQAARLRAEHATGNATPASASSSVSHTTALASTSVAREARHSACGSG